MLSLGFTIGIGGVAGIPEAANKIFRGLLLLIDISEVAVMSLRLLVVVSGVSMTCGVDEH